MVGFIVLGILLSFPIVIVFELGGVLFYIVLSLWIILMIILTILLSINFYKILDKIFKGNEEWSSLPNIIFYYYSNRIISNTSFFHLKGILKMNTLDYISEYPP